MAKYDVQVNSKVTRETADLLKETGHPTRDALEYYVRDFFSKQPWRIIKIDNFYLEKELKEINEELDRLEFDKLKIIDKIRFNNSELDKYSNQMSEYDLEKSKYSESCIKAIESIQEMFDKRSFIAEDSVFDVIDSSVFVLKAKNCNMDVEEFKEAVKEMVI